MSTILRKAAALIVLLCLILMQSVAIYAAPNPNIEVTLKHETVPLSQDASKTKLVSGDLLYDGGNWTLALSSEKTQEAQLLYEDAVLYKGNTYDVLMKITASSDDYAEMVISNRNLTYSVNGDEITRSDGEKIAALAEEYASHEPRYNYVLGGRELSTEKGHGLDCAHFVGRVYEDCGQPELTSSGADANVNHLHDDLADTAVNDIIEDGPAKLSEIKRGDILIFYKDGHPSHTAIYVGDGKIAHAMDEDNGVCIIDMKYNEETGVVGYSGKTLQRVLRPAKTTTVTPDAKANINVEYSIVDQNMNPVGGLDIGAVITNGDDVIKASKLTAHGKNNGCYAENSTIYEEAEIASKDGTEIVTELETYIPVFVDYKEWSMDQQKIKSIFQVRGGKLVK